MTNTAKMTELITAAQAVVDRWDAPQHIHKDEEGIFVMSMTNQQGAPKALRFTKKPVTIEAIQWTGKNLREVITFIDGSPDTRSHHAGMVWETYADLVARDGLKIYTLEGKMLADVGDWIIRGVKGEYYPCKPDIFEATYSPAAQVEALSAAQAGAPVIPAMMYLMLTDAMGYDSGEDGTTWSPEEWAAHLYSFYKSKTAADWKLVPKGPTPDMVRAGWELLPSTAGDRWDAGAVLARSVYSAMLAAAPQPVVHARQADSVMAPAGAAPLPLLVRDIAADFGVTPVQVCLALVKLGFGHLSVNMAITPEMAEKLREYFADAPAQPAPAATPQADSGAADSVLEDATRYQWLRLALADRTNNGKSHWFCSIAAGHPEELDAAIDEAMAAKNGG